MDPVKVIHHFCHEHPLILTANVGNRETLRCYGCRKHVISESAYVCVNKCSSTSTSVLHKKCAELPRQILHPSHPQHPLHLFDYQVTRYWCNLCRAYFKGELGYQCSNCNFDIHISCQEQGNADLLLEQKMLHHPSHHYHPLSLIRKPAFSFYCDGCGTENCDMAYACGPCEFLIHKTCASLPMFLSINHHRHRLFLAFNFPIEHRKFMYTCDICDKGFHMTCWVYCCGDCRYFAHVRCALSISSELEATNLNAQKIDDSGLIQLPVNDISEELITPFVLRENSFNKIPDMPESIIMPETTASFSYLFKYHRHSLSLVTEEEPTHDDELMICDVCVTPICSPPYYKCATATCKHSVHSICYLLPKTLSTPPDSTALLYGDCRPTQKNHKLRVATKRDGKWLEGFLSCNLCGLDTNGMVYKCKNCELIIDVKCASLPTTVKHASHQQHKLIMGRISEEEEVLRGKSCHADCGCSLAYKNAIVYLCSQDDCDYVLHLRCALQIQSIKHEWDKHPLLLTYSDASIDHPTDFYCEMCEEIMHPKKWMYHCRECDRSFHPYCLDAAGWSSNIKFGQQIEIYQRHPHPLAYNLVTLKLRCDHCHREVYKDDGLECALCNYVLCFFCV